MGSSLDRYHEYLITIKDRILCMGEVGVIEVCRDDLSFIGKGVLTCLFDDRSDVIPNGSSMIFDQGSCLALGRRVFEKLFKMKVQINELLNQNLRGHVRVIYSDGREELYRLG